MEVLWFASFAKPEHCLPKIQRRQGERTGVNEQFIDLNYQATTGHSDYFNAQRGIFGNAESAAMQKKSVIAAGASNDPLAQTFVLGLMVIGMMIVGAVFLYFVTDGLLWLEGYVRD